MLDWPGPWHYGPAQHKYLAFFYYVREGTLATGLCGWIKVWNFELLVIPVLFYGCETWTLNTDLKRQIDVFGTGYLSRIMRYCWYDFVSYQRLSRETDSRLITSIVRQHQLLLWAVAHYLETNPAYWVVSERDNPAWRREAKGMPTELMAVASCCLLLEITQYGKGACMGTREA